MGTNVGFNEKFDATSGGFLVHPDGWTGPAVVEEVEKFEKDGDVTVIVLHLDCEGAKVREQISLVTTEKYTKDLIKWKVSAPLLSAGLRKSGDQISPADLMKLKGKKCRVRLEVSSFKSKNTGAILQNNKVSKWIEAGTTAAKSETAAKESKKEAKDDFDF